MLDTQTFRLLLSPPGQEALRAAEQLEPREVDFLSHYTTLSRRFPSELARIALETAILRREGLVKFPFSGKMYFTRQALEQATAYEVSQYRAGRFRSFQRLIDLGCSIGGDTLALAGSAFTIGIDLDLLRLEMARANLRALGLERQTSFVCADLAQPLPFPRTSNPGETALFFDPARRTKGQRIFTVRDYHPPLSIVHSWLDSFPSLAVKISPGVKLVELAAYQAELEFVSLRGELKEAVLWFGSLKTASRRATLLPGPHTLSAPEAPIRKLPLSEPQAYLYEPDPAVLRAGLVAPLGEQLGAVQLDPEIAYLTAPDRRSSPFTRVWQVEAWFPFGLKRLRAYLRQNGVGHVVVKKRGSPLQPEDLIRDLRLKGENQRVVFLTQCMGNPVVIVCLPG